MTAVAQPIDRAFVEIVPDFDAFAREVRTGVDRAMRDLANEVDRGLAQVEREFAQAGDDIGHEFDDAGRQADQAFEQIARSAESNAEQVQQSFSSSAELAEGSITELRRSAGRDFDRISHQATITAASVSGKFSAAFASTLPLLGGVTLAVGAGLGALTAFGLKATATLEQTRISFDSLLGSAQKGGEVFKDLQQFAAVTPFEFPEVAGAAQRFFAFNDAVGMSDDQVRKFLTTIGNVASVTGGGAQALNSVTLAMGQIASSGKVTLENLNQISEALPGFSGVAAIASATGKTTAQTMADISSGSLSAKDGIQALLIGMDKFPGAAGAMEKQSQTLLGVFSTFKDTISQALVAGFEPVIPEIKASLTEVTPILKEAIGEIAPVLGKTLSILLPLIAKLVQAITPILEPIINALGPALEKIDLVALGEALGELVTSLVPLIPLAAEFANATAQLLIPVLLLLAMTLRPLTPVINFMTKAIAEFGRALSMIDWADVAAAIILFFADIGEAIGGFFIGIVDFFAELPGRIMKVFAETGHIAQTQIKMMVGFITAIPGQIVAAIGNLGKLLFSAGRDVVAGLWAGIQSLGGWLRGKILAFAKSAIPDPLERFFGIASPSEFMADRIGEPLAQGIGVGFERGLGQVGAMLANATQTVAGGVGGGTANAAAATAVFGPKSIYIVINGNVTEDQAAKIGAAAGNGISSALARRGITTAVRQV